MSGYAQYTVNVPIFRGAFVNLFDPKKVTRKDKKTGETIEKDSWGMTMLFKDGENLDEVKALATKLMEDKFGDKSKWPKPFHPSNNPNGWTAPWRKQWEKCEDNPDIDKSYDGFSKNGLFMNATTNRQPEVVDQKVQKILDRSRVYSGAWFMASVTLFWYDNESKGIGCSLGPVQLIKNDDPLGGGGISAAEAFAPVDVDGDSDAGSVFEDETDGEDDPFA